ncbi:transmembrane protein 42-like protein [Chytriomyces sp. MP71]|nr:transmembrane protein 42-like protein [Chytriomyces sp. MP71]
MWAVFTRALNSSHSTAAVSVLNNSANMIASAFLGYLMFDEELSVKWWIGCILVIAGSALMNRGAQSTLSNAKVKCE